MHVAVDQARQQRESTPIDPLGASRDRNGSAGAGGANRSIPDNDGGSFDYLPAAVDESGVLNRNRHVAIPRGEM